MTLAVDLDGTLSDYPMQLRNIMIAMQSAGHHVVVISGSGNNPPSGDTWDDKIKYLAGLGCADCFDDLIVVSGDVPAQKAKWCADNGVHTLIDNSVKNVKAAADSGVPLVLVPWLSRVKDESGKKP